MRKHAWLVAFAVLLAVAAFLMARGDKPQKPERVLKAEFPRKPQGWEEERNRKRRTLPPLAPQGGEEAPALTKRDPLVVALPSDPKKSTVVFEVAALKESPIGQIWLDCLLAREGARDGGPGRGREEFKERFGIDPFEDVERIGVSSGKVAVLSVASGAAKIDRSGWPKQTFGEKGVIYESEEGAVMATWGDEIVLAGGDRQAIEEAIERLESKQPSEPSIPDWSMYGDIYGKLSPEDLADMIPADQPELAAQLRDAVQAVDLHVDASEDVAIVADVNGEKGEDVNDLAKSFGAALSVARATAEEQGDDRLSELLEFAKVRPHEGRFSVDVALPLDVLKQMGPCRKRDAKR
ncbi:hypothetical protein [Polyangium aurulentum]|uniref:hypothetical protein n=1 Tax=Polyangium aurulentum TaxID=2567896 RepID=UPI0010AE6308|nr:hypothetical protein [Polyangium aurulentum]UQA59026.1 hypothetical protein E8A73_000455 [Polyangium aurulentum]